MTTTKSPEKMKLGDKYTQGNREYFITAFLDEKGNEHGSYEEALSQCSGCKKPIVLFNTIGASDPQYINVTTNN